MSRVKELKTDQEFASVLHAADKTNALLVVDFTAAWCGPCESLIFELVGRQCIGM